MHYKVTSKYTVKFLASHYAYLSLLLDNGRNLTHTYKELTNVGWFLNPLLVISKFLARLYIWLMVLILQTLTFDPTNNFFWRFRLSFSMTPRNNWGSLKETWRWTSFKISHCQGSFIETRPWKSLGFSRFLHKNLTFASCENHLCFCEVLS
jgi:hypothetical protein